MSGNINKATKVFFGNAGEHSALSLDAKFIDLYLKVSMKLQQILWQKKKKREGVKKYWKGSFGLFRLDSEEDLRDIQ